MECGRWSWEGDLGRSGLFLLSSLDDRNSVRKQHSGIGFMIDNLHADAVVSTFEGGFSTSAPLASSGGFLAFLGSPDRFCVMSSDGLVARVGREKQRYENHFRLVSGCIPYKLIEPVEDGAGGSLSSLRVLMISTPNRHDLIFPKGGWENDETDEEAACREAMEEAGVRGIIRGPLGIWEFRSKSKQHSCSLKGWCKGSMFALEVTEELSSWPEQESYKRNWLTVSEACERCRYDWMREALNKFLVLLSGESEPSCSEIPEPSISAKLYTMREGNSKLTCSLVNLYDFLPCSSFVRNQS